MRCNKTTTTTQDLLTPKSIKFEIWYIRQVLFHVIFLYQFSVGFAPIKQFIQQYNGWLISINIGDSHDVTAT